VRMIQSKPDSTILLMTASVVHQARAMLDLLNRYNWCALAVVTSTQTCSRVLTPDRSQPVSVVSVGLGRCQSVSVGLCRSQSISVGFSRSQSVYISVGLRQSLSVSVGLSRSQSVSVSLSRFRSRDRTFGLGVEVGMLVSTSTLRSEFRTQPVSM